MSADRPDEPGSDDVTVEGPPHDATPSLDHGAFTPGTVLASRYRIVGLVGRGGMGEVYRADDLTLGQPVALKFLHAGQHDNENLIARLRDEVRTARQVSHPNVCRVHDVGEVAGRTFVSMEYIDGEDLASLLRRIGRLPKEKAVDLVRQVCAGLAAAHDRGVLHRDLKPANIMLDSRGKVRLTDFGLASFATGPSTRAGPGARDIAGTPAYMAPEQVTGDRLTPQTDLYAVGLLLAELVTGKRVFGNMSLAARQRSVAPPAAVTSSVRESVDPRILDTIDRCLESDPSQRPASALALAAGLPGMDLLAAALAAGETPAPEVVAAAGDSGGLSVASATAWLAAVPVLCLALLYLRGLDSYSRYVDFPYSPEVLAARAAEVRTRLGYDAASGYEVGGFLVIAGYPYWKVEREPPPPPLDFAELPLVRPALVLFWQHTSDRPWVNAPVAFFGQGTSMITARAVVPPDTPRGPRGPGDVYVELRPDGALSAFEAEPPLGGWPDAPDRTVDWDVFFDEARLDRSAFVTQIPGGTGSSRTNPGRRTQTVWIGPSPAHTDVELRIEGAAVDGRPVSFRMYGPWLPSSTVMTPYAVNVPFQILFLLLIGLAVVLARRNLQRGRVDRRGAWRVSLVAGGALAAAQVVEVHHEWSSTQFGVVLGAISWAVFIGAVAWLLYVGLEPHVRRLWPRALVTWTRLVAGGWRDRLVGRDLLIGLVAGLGGAIAEAATLLLGSVRTGLTPLVAVDFQTLSSMSAVAAAFLRTVSMAALFPLLLVCLLLLVRLVSPRSWVTTTLATLVVFIAISPEPFDPLLELPIVALWSAAMIVLALRFGLLMIATFVYVNALAARVFVAPDLSPFFAPMMIVGILIVLLPGLVGYYASVRGREVIVGRLG